MVTWKIFDLGDRIGFVRTTTEDDYKHTVYVNKREATFSSSGTDLLVYHKVLTLPTTELPLLIIAVADITYPVIATAARMAAVLNLYVSSANSGKYTPTLTNVANLSGSTAYEFKYSRVDNVVTFSGKVTVNPVMASVTTQLGISFPIASVIATEEDCAGSAASSDVISESASVHGDVANARCEMHWITNSLNDHTMFLSAQYILL